MMNEVDWWGLETQHSDTVTRDELKTSLAAAIARAEAAEKRVAELEAELSRISGRLSATEAVMDEFEELMGIND